MISASLSNSLVQRQGRNITMRSENSKSILYKLLIDVLRIEMDSCQKLSDIQAVNKLS